MNALILKSRVYLGVHALDSFLDSEALQETEVQTLVLSLTHCVTRGHASYPF